MARVLLGEFVLVGEHAVPTIDIPPGEGLWRLMEKPFTYLGLVGSRGVKPGFGQGEGGVVYPGWTRNIVALTEPFNRSGTEGRPTEGISIRFLWQSNRISDEMCTLIFGIVKPFIHEIAQGYPWPLTVTDGLIGHDHGLYAITCFQERPSVLVTPAFFSRLFIVSQTLRGK